MHADFGLPLPMMRHTEFPHYYRRHEEGESEEAFATRMAGALDKLIVEENPDTVAASFAEPAMGAAPSSLRAPISNGFRPCRSSMMYSWSPTR